MDIVYALGSGSLCKNREIMYSLRSVEKHLANIGKVFLVGHCPEFLKDVIHIPFPDKHGESGISKAFNVKEKIMAACRDRRLTKEFLFMADDHFLLKDHDAKTFPYYNMGQLEERLKRGNPHDNYLKTYHNTIALLKKRGLPLLDYNPHGPIRYKKDIFIQVMQSLEKEWNVKWGHLIKSLYCNMVGGATPTEYFMDCKPSRPYTEDQIKGMITGQPLFSIGDRAIMNGHKIHPPMINVLNELYPNKSRWES